MISNIVFDHDGTLSDPIEGIADSVAHAMASCGRPRIAVQDLGRWIGPPLREMFGALLRSDDPSLIESAVARYREHYFETGLFQNRLYDGVREMLVEMQAEGRRLFVATSKVRSIATDIIRHFGLAHLFVGIYGSEADGTFDDKAELLGHLVRTERLDPRTMVMIGDRKHDILAARAVGCLSIGVTYGYGSRAELVEHGADFICDRPSDVVGMIESIREADSSIG